MATLTCTDKKRKLEEYEVIEEVEEECEGGYIDMPTLKKRKLDNSEISILDIIMDTTIDNIFGHGNEMDTKQLEGVSDKLESMQNAIKIRIMNSISFANLNVAEMQEYLLKFVECTYAKVNENEREDYGLTIRDLNTNGKFLIGPNKTALIFECYLHQGCEVEGNISMDKLWNVEIENFECKNVNINLSEIERLVKESGIKGIGNQMTKSNSNKNNGNDSEEYFKFTFVLSTICLNLIEEKSNENCWYGCINDLHLIAIEDALKCGDEVFEDVCWS
eukprot:323933_1